MSRTWRIFLVIAILTCGACRGSDSHPESRRSLAAGERVKASLSKSLQERGMQWGGPVLIRIYKEEKRLELWCRRGERFEIFKRYPILAASGELGPKLKEGDGQSPEGYYQISAGSLNPNSRYHLSFNLGFPNAYDKAHKRTGSFLMVHGSNVSIGCYAIGDPAIEEVYTLVDQALRHGQKSIQVHCYPFRMDDDAFAKHAKSPWIGFWTNLREGDTLFREKRMPIKATVDGKRYKFE